MQRDDWGYTNKEQDAEAQSQYNTNTEGINIYGANPMVADNNNNKINYFLLGQCQEADRSVSVKITLQLQKEFKDVFTGVDCFYGMFSLQVKVHSKLYWAPPKICR